MNGAEYDLLVEPTFTVRVGSQPAAQRDLPQVLSFLGAGKRDQPETEVEFQALQPHQRHAWYSLLVHLGALALREIGETDPLQGEARYRQGLLKLSGGRPWWLIEPDVSKPGFLQVPTDGRLLSEENLKNRLLTPDELDVIPQGANHSRKRRSIVDSRPEHWVYAMASVQGQGVAVAKYRACVRSTGSGRICVTLAEALSLSARYVRDVRIALDERQEIARTHKLTGKRLLLWLESWDGETALGAEDVAPLFVDSPRILRVLREKGKLVAYCRMTAASRVLLGTSGGDLWTPISRAEKSKGRSLGFGGGETEDRLRHTDVVGQTGYAKLHSLVFGEDTIKPASVRHPIDGSGYLIVSGLITNKGKTLGYHERTIPIQSKFVSDLGLDNAQSRMAALSREHVQIAADIEEVLGQALYTLMLGEEAPRKSLKKRNEKQHGRILSVFESALDDEFFEHLFQRLETDTPEPWFRFVMGAARAVIESASRTSVHWAGKFFKGVAHASLVLDRYETAQRAANERLGGAEEVMVQTPETYKKLSETIGKIHNYVVALSHRDRGAIAKLRRMDPERPVEPELFDMEAAYIDRSGLPEISHSQREQDRRWTTVVKWNAEAVGLHGGSTSTGRALAEAGLSSQRFERLLTADDSSTADAVIDNTVRFLRHKRQRFSMTDLAMLYLYPMTVEANDVRRKMAKEYYPAARH